MSEPIEIPTTVEEITAVWLTEALRESGVIGEETAVVSLTVEPMHGAGALGQMARLRPVYARFAENMPTSFIAKYSHADPDTRLMFRNTYATEIRVYQELFDQIPLTMPHCYYSAIDIKTGNSVMILEDLGHLRQKSYRQGCSLQEAETVVTHLARHHAQWWESPQLETLDYLDNLPTTVSQETIEDYQLNWSQFADRVAEVMPDCYLPTSFLEIGYRYGFQKSEIARQIVDSPTTLIHDDIHLDNVMFGASKDDPELTVIDWQGCSLGPGPRDIGYFLIASLPVRQRREAEKRLLQRYHTILVEQGVSDYGFAQCWRDYRLSFFRNLNILVFMVGFGHVDLKSSYMQGMLKAAIPRVASFAADHRLDEFFVEESFSDKIKIAD